MVWWYVGSIDMNTQNLRDFDILGVVDIPKRFLVLSVLAIGWQKISSHNP